MNNPGKQVFRIRQVNNSRNDSRGNHIVFGEICFFIDDIRTSCVTMIGTSCRRVT